MPNHAGLPEIFLDVIEEAGLLGPAGIDHDLADVALNVGCQGTGAVVVLVVALAGIDGNEVVLDAPFYATWHVVVDGAETDRHAYGFVVTVHGTVGLLHLWVVEVDGLYEDTVLGCIAGEDAAQAVLPQRTNSAVANVVVVSLHRKYLFSGLGGKLLLFHICRCLFPAKVVTNSVICKFFI